MEVQQEAGRSDDASRIRAAHKHAACGVAGIACLGMAAASLDQASAYGAMRRTVTAELRTARGLLRARQSVRNEPSAHILLRGVESALELAADEARSVARTGQALLPADWVALRLKPIVRAIRAAEDLCPNLRSGRRLCDHGQNIDLAGGYAGPHLLSEIRGRNE